MIYFVAEPLRSDDGDFIADSLVGFEIEGEFGIVAFDQDFGGFLHGLVGGLLVLRFRHLSQCQ